MTLMSFFTDVTGTLPLFEMVYGLFGSAISILAFIAMGYGVYTMSKTCNLPNPILAWIPFCQIYQLGALADYVCEHGEGRKTRYRRVLLVLSIVMFATVFVSLIIMIISAVAFIVAVGAEAFENEMIAIENLLSAMVPSLLILLAGLVIAIVYLVNYFIALHHIYKNFDPRNATVYTVVSIFISYATPIFFAFILTKKRPVFDEGEAFAPFDPDPAAPAADPTATPESAPADGDNNTPYSL